MSTSLDQPVEVLDLPVRPYNCIKRANINTLGELCEQTWEDLWDLRHFGEVSLKAVEKALAVHGLALKPSEYPRLVGA